MNSTLITDRKAFRKKVESLKSLPTLPHLMMKFTQMSKDPKTSMAQFGKEIGKDQNITSKLLRLVNSAFYGFPGRISTVTQAVVILGIDALKGLIVTSGVFDGLTPEAYPLWRHSMLVSLTCRYLGKLIDLNDIEEIIVAGLLHDIGKVVMILEAPEDYRKVIKNAEESKLPLWQIEEEMLGFSHADIGKWLCEKWTLPEKLAEPIACHHTLQNSIIYKERTYVVILANTIVKALGAPSEQNIPLEDLPESITSHFNLDKRNIALLIEKLEPEVEALKYLAPKDLK